MKLNPRIEFEEAVRYQKSNGKEYEDCDLDDQMRLCALYIKTWRDSEQWDCLDDLDVRHVLAAMAEGDKLQVGELVTSAIMRFVEKQTEAGALIEIAYNGVESDGLPEIDEEEWIDRRNRARDMAAA